MKNRTHNDAIKNSSVGPLSQLLILLTHEHNARKYLNLMQNFVQNNAMKEKSVCDFIYKFDIIFNMRYFEATEIANLCGHLFVF